MFLGDDIQSCIKFVVDAHSGQNRKNVVNDIPLPYVFHVFEVTKQLYDWGMVDQNTLLASLLHDVVEDNYKITVDDISKTFNGDVAQIVDELTFYYNSGESKNDYMKSFYNKRVESIVIKVSDRLCNTADFINSDIMYAVKYFEKASSLFNCFLKVRHNDIMAKYGNVAYLNMANAFSNVRNRIEDIK